MHGHGHSHASSSPWWNYRFDRAGIRLGIGALVALGVALIGTVVLWPDQDTVIPAVFDNVGVDRLDVTVEDVVREQCFASPVDIQCDTITIRLPDGTNGSFQQTPSVYTAVIEPGDEIVVANQTDPNIDARFRFYFLDFQRTRALLLLAGIFAAAVILLGRLQGLRSLVALGIDAVILVGFTLPALLETSSPVLVAIVGSAGVATVTLYLTHGISHLSTVSLLGSLASLGLTGTLAWFFVEATNLTGLSNEDALYLLAGNEAIDLRGILLAGMIIGTVGILDDVTVTQSSAVAELHDANPTMGATRLYRAALRVGRDHIGSTTNTLVFAYAGAALPLLMLLTQAQLDLSRALTSEIIAIEIVRALVGGIGLIAAVPITTTLATWVVHATPPSDEQPATRAPQISTT